VAEVAREGREVVRGTPLPVGVGFGIRDGATAKAVARGADAVIIGTRMIQVLEDGPPESAAERAGRFVAEVRGALDSDSPAR